MGIVRYAAVRILQAVPTVFGVIVAIFLLVRILPGDPAAVILGEFATKDAIAATREKLGLNRPLHEQFISFAVGAVQGDFGRSYTNNQPATRNITTALGNTALLALGGITISILLGVPAGIIAALRRGHLADYIVMTVSLLGVSLPIFWLAVILLMLLAVRLGWFPVIGAGSGPGFVDHLWHLVLPSLALGVNLAGLIARMTRSSMLTILSKDYLRTARAKGLRASRVIIGHALRNALVPIVTVVGLNLGSLLGGTVLTEVVFARPGLGRVLVDAVFSRDFPQIQASIAFFAVVVVALNILVDILYRFLDPRIEYGRGR